MNAETGETVTAGDRGPESELGPGGHPGHDVPWLQILRLHQAVAVRTDRHFGLIDAQDQQSPHWSSLEAFQPGDRDEPWSLPAACIRSESFRSALGENGGLSLFIGGPCLPDWAAVDADGPARLQWRPLFYREVQMERAGDRFAMVPRQPGWSVNPQLPRLIERLEVCPDADLEGLFAALVGTGEGPRHLPMLPLDQRILEALSGLVPGIADELAAQWPADDAGPRPGPWILFAPDAADSDGTSLLVGEYRQLEALLQENSSDPGGLRVLEGCPVGRGLPEAAMLPLVPLSGAQRQAVERVLRGERLTVIDGPPGTGKTEVIVSLLLNAWVHGRSALVVSVGDRAVDVIRERVGRFETGFPIVVRAGTGPRQDVSEALRRILGSADPAASESASEAADLLRQRDALREERTRWLAALESDLPERIEASGGAVFAAYAESRATRDVLEQQDTALTDEQAALGLASFAPDRVDDVLAATRGWLERMAHYQDLVRQDDQRRSDLEQEIRQCRRRRDQAVAEAGLSATNGGDWDWLLGEPGPALLEDWEAGWVTYLGEPLEEILAPYAWRDAYDRWPSVQAAEDWAAVARSLAEAVRALCREVSPELERVQEVRKALDKQRVKLRGLGLPEGFDSNTGPIKGWLATHATLQGLARDRADFLPWSPRSQLQRRLRRLERQLLPSLPAAVLNSLGTMDERGRSRLATVLEAAQRSADLGAEWDESQRFVRPLEDRFRSLCRDAAALDVVDVPESLDPDAWIDLAARHEQAAILADHAARAWRSRAVKENAQETLRRMAADWGDLIVDVPLLASWCRGPGQAFDATVRALASEPESSRVVGAREVFSSGSLTRLRRCWERAAEHERSARRLRAELLGLPAPTDRIRAWRGECPEQGLLHLAAGGDGWLEPDAALERLDRIADWCVRWRLFQQEDRPCARQRAEGQVHSAITGLEESLQILPPGPASECLQGLVDAIREDPLGHWPLTSLRDAYAAFHPDALQARIESIESALGQRALAYATAERLERLRTDGNVSDAIQALRQTVEQDPGGKGLQPWPDFQALLSVLPIWTATTADLRVLPLEPGLFDIVVIDEAPQCTLTSVLPAIYRGRALVVAGDANLLAAVHGMPAGEEHTLAGRLRVDAWLARLGHSGNDIHRAATNVLKAGREAPILLDEVYRGHPEIVALANRCADRRKLRLPREPADGNERDRVGGVRTIAVEGSARPGADGRSWVNEAEAARAAELIRELMEEGADALSVGLISPFAAQRELLRERLDTMGIASGRLVVAAEELQGRERDVIVFSPVVATGMPATIRRWVDSPPNRLHLALTRAREALFLVADIDQCVEQEGRLGEVARHGRDMQRLRESGRASFELFTWMLLQGWTPKVRPRIGDLEVDFVWEPLPGQYLAIEIDGGESGFDKERDKAREAYLYWMGFERLRIEGQAVMDDPRDVIAGILRRQEKSH
nr:AAA domain-containing protein [Thioalkalivibrio sp.]